MQECNHSSAAAVSEAVASSQSPAAKQKEILVPIDFSESSVTALRCARALAEGGRTQVILLNVVEGPGSFCNLDVVGQQRARYTQRAERLQELADRELGSQVAARIEVREGRPSAEIVRLATERRVDLIVVGRHDHHGPRRWLHEYTAAQLAKKAPCSVLLLHAGHHLN
jgi:nucleotide-binding universal stress UspA family protein